MMSARPGAIGTVPVSGTGGLLIRVGEFILDHNAGAQHAFVLLDDDTVLEAEPDGARIVSLREYNNVEITWLDPPISDSARAVVVSVARSKEKVGYNWWAYLWLILHKFGFSPKWVLHKMDNPKNAMCSQLADRVYLEAADIVTAPMDRFLLHLFRGRDPGAVTPGDLKRLADSKPWKSYAATSS